MRMPVSPELKWDKMRHRTHHPPMCSSPCGSYSWPRTAPVPCTAMFSSLLRLALESEELISGTADKLGSNLQQGPPGGNCDFTPALPFLLSQLFRGNLSFCMHPLCTGRIIRGQFCALREPMVSDLRGTQVLGCLVLCGWSFVPMCP